MIVDNYLEDILKKHFQKSICLTLNSEEYKCGKFTLYKLTTYANNYYIEFHIKREKKNDLIKIPYPFKIEEHEEDNLLFFDYRISTLCNKNKKLMEKIYDVSDQYEDCKKNKFFDNILEIKFE